MGLFFLAIPVSSPKTRIIGFVLQNSPPGWRREAAGTQIKDQVSKIRIAESRRAGMTSLVLHFATFILLSFLGAAGKETPLLLGRTARSLRRKRKNPPSRIAQLPAATAIKKVLQTEGFHSKALHVLCETWGERLARPSRAGTHDLLCEIQGGWRLFRPGQCGILARGRKMRLRRD